MVFYPYPSVVTEFESARCGIEFVEARHLADDTTGHIERWLVKEVALARVAEMERRMRLVRHGLAYVERPMPAEGDDLIILTGLTDRGEKARGVLKRGLAYRVEMDAEDIDATLDFHLSCIRCHRRLAWDDVRRAKRIEHPIRDRILTEMTKWMMISKREFDTAGDWIPDPEVETI